MTQKPVAAALTAALIAVGGVFGAGQAQAIIYTGVFDPSNGVYEWSGTHKFDVSEACLTTDGWKPANDGYGCDITLIDGSLTLERLSPSTAGPYTLDFSDFGGALNDPNDVWGVYVQNGQVTGVDTRLIGGFKFTFAQTYALGFAVDFDEYTAEDAFYIRWESGKAPGYAVPGDLFPTPWDPGSNQSYIALVDPSYLYVNSCGVGECTTREVTPGVSAPRVTFVPEPATWTLLLGAFAAAVWRRRRRGG